MKQYLDLMQDIIDKGNDKSDRTGVGIRSVFGRQLRFDLRQGFPLLTTKKMYTRAIIHELLWFLNGDTNIRYLQENQVSIWDDWATKTGDLGPVYGAQWRSWVCHDGSSVDQITELIDQIKTKPNSRRLIITAWNPADLPNETMSPQENVEQGKMALAPCHCLFQFYVVDRKLSCQLYQRSADYFLGVPFNIASYALFIHMIAQQCDLEVGDFVHTFGDVHIYRNHLTDKIVYEQLKRSPRTIPTLKIKRKPESIFGYRFEDFEIEGYEAQSMIRAPIAI
ncbi:thymidylate synthase [Candidatus Enterovibrio escicola]|uniref:Thymidylate synthase n=1 Tax=Candidatus Enterovibrio escicola TaxID=1927127 RepID=A0A2A5T600_9GAMM|nr:thymidylate synthase [Candidatus Enterovibrio escacola]PCS23581.1 Thymidylate synthase [Candidatus Enterovibrio escacola]